MENLRSICNIAQQHVWKIIYLFNFGNVDIYLKNIIKNVSYLMSDNLD